MLTVVKVKQSALPRIQCMLRGQSLSALCGQSQWWWENVRRGLLGVGD